MFVLFHLTWVPDYRKEIFSIGMKCMLLGRFRESLCYRLKAESFTVSFSLSFFWNILRNINLSRVVVQSWYLNTG